MHLRSSRWCSRQTRGLRCCAMGEARTRAVRRLIVRQELTVCQPPHSWPPQTLTSRPGHRVGVVTP